jgi:hypothetical protein
MEYFARAAVAAGLLLAGILPASADESATVPVPSPAVVAAAAPASPQRDPAAEVVFRALSLLGVNYRWGGNTPETGLDCSGLVRLVFHDTLGLPLPRRSDEISRVGGDVSPTELQPGDLVFFNTLRRAFSHVGIYIGNNQFVHAPSSGGAVRVESLGASYWSARFDGARRLLHAEPAIAAVPESAAPRLADAPPIEATRFEVALNGADRTGTPSTRSADPGSPSPSVRATARRSQPTAQRRGTPPKTVRASAKPVRSPAVAARPAGSVRQPTQARRVTVASAARDARAPARGQGSIYLN